MRSVVCWYTVRDKVVALTVGNAFGVDVDFKKLQLRKLRCFAQTLNVAAQKVYTSNIVNRWVSKITAAVTWMKRSSTAEKLLQKNKQLLSECIMSFWLFRWSKRHTVRGWTSELCLSSRSPATLFNSWCPNTLGLFVSHGEKVCRVVYCHTGHHHRSTYQTVNWEEKVIKVKSKIAMLYC